MQFTNELGLPDGFVRAVTNDTYSKGDADFSVTELLKPARQSALQEKHFHEIVEDVADRTFVLFGQSVHSLLERANKDNQNELTEKRFFAQFGNYTVSAQVDSMILEGGVLSDYKVTTIYKAQLEKPDPDFVAQLNMQAEILRRNIYFPKVLQIIALLRDWSKYKASSDPDLPQKEIIIIPIPMWSKEEAEKFIIDRIAAHLEAKENLTDCSRSERWADEEKWAVMDGKKKRALKLCSTKPEADHIVNSNPGTLWVEYRPGNETKRCDFYCNVNKFCSQYKRLVERSNIFKQRFVKRGA